MKVLVLLLLVSAIGGLAGGWAFLSDQWATSLDMETLGGRVLAGKSLPVVDLHVPLPLPVSTLVGAFLFFLGLAGLLMVWGMWTGKRWAWKITLVLAILQVIFSVGQVYWIGLAVIQELWIALQLVIIYYLYGPQVRAYVGK